MTSAKIMCQYVTFNCKTTADIICNTSLYRKILHLL